jgi:hypothetical protein
MTSEAAPPPPPAPSAPSTASEGEGITTLNPNDVLLGRGSAMSSYIGNKVREVQLQLAICPTGPTHFNSLFTLPPFLSTAFS